jgi:ABC-type ATPase with predicted acetyltransferase domain
MLCRVGLGEVWTYLKSPAQLSQGQRCRLRLALSLARAAGPRRECDGRLNVLAADEFCAPLDRLTALIVARALRKSLDLAAAKQHNVAAVLATSHDDLAPALCPDLRAHCDFGRIEVSQPPKR